MLSHEIRRSAISLCYPLFSHAFATWCPLCFLNIDIIPKGSKWLVELCPPLSIEIFSGGIKMIRQTLLLGTQNEICPVWIPVYQAKQDIILPRIGVFLSNFVANVWLVREKRGWTILPKNRQSLTARAPKGKDRSSKHHASGPRLNCTGSTQISLSNPGK